MDDSFGFPTFWVTEDYFQRLNQNARTDFLISLSFLENATAAPFDLVSLASFSPTRKKRIRECIVEKRLCHHCLKLVSEAEIVVCNKLMRQSHGRPRLDNLPSQRSLIPSFLCQFTKEGRTYCPRQYCKFCLKYNYEEKEPYVNGKFACPACKGKCFCQRCQRRDNMMRILKYYKTLGGFREELLRGSELSRLSRIFYSRNAPQEAIALPEEKKRKRTKRKAKRKGLIVCKTTVAPQPVQSSFEQFDIHEEEEYWLQKINLERHYDILRRLRVVPSLTKYREFCRRTTLLREIAEFHSHVDLEDDSDSQVSVDLSAEQAAQGGDMWLGKRSIPRWLHEGGEDWLQGTMDSPAGKAKAALGGETKRSRSRSHQKEARLRHKTLTGESARISKSGRRRIPVMLPDMAPQRERKSLRISKAMRLNFK